MSKTFMIRTQEHLDNLKSILQEEFDKGNGLALATAVRQIKYVQSRDVFDATVSYAPDTFDKIQDKMLPNSALGGEDRDLIMGIWSSKTISQKEELVEHE